MAKITATERERWVLFSILDPMGHANRSERRKVDRIWEALQLDDIDAKIALYAPGTQVDPRIFDAVETPTYELTSDQRDFVIDLLDKPGITTKGGRLLRRFETEMIKGRDGEAAAAS